YQVADVQLKQHEIRNKIRLPHSRVKTIYRNSGDGIKASEPIIQLVNDEYLIAEGMVDVQYMERLRRPKRVILEPTLEEAPLQKLQAHHAEITAVAVTADDHILTGSEDRTVYVWSRRAASPLHRLAHAEPVRCLACTPRDGKGNWCAVGCT